MTLLLVSGAISGKHAFFGHQLLGDTQLKNKHDIDFCAANPSSYPRHGDAKTGFGGGGAYNKRQTDDVVDSLNGEDFNVTTL